MKIFPDFSDMNQNSDRISNRPQKVLEVAAQSAAFEYHCQMFKSFVSICINMYSRSIFNVESDSEIKNLIFLNILKFWIWIQNSNFRFLFYSEKNICDRVNPQLSKMPKISLIGPQNREICLFLWVSCTIVFKIQTQKLEILHLLGTLSVKSNIFLDSVDRLKRSLAFWKAEDSLYHNIFFRIK